MPQSHACFGVFTDRLKAFGVPPFDSPISAALRPHLAHAAGGALIVPMTAF
jgi:hypothetical protein